MRAPDYLGIDLCHPDMVAHFPPPKRSFPWHYVVFGLVCVSPFAAIAWLTVIA